MRHQKRKLWTTVIPKQNQRCFLSTQSSSGRNENDFDFKNDRTQYRWKNVMNENEISEKLKCNNK